MSRSSDAVQVKSPSEINEPSELREAVREVLRDVGKIVSPDGIDSTRRVLIGGVHQYIHIRGQSSSAPLLLFLHGGPNSVISDVAWSYQRGWEDFFVVVNWDQRGAGRSFGAPEQADRISNTLNREQYRSDAIELIEYLCAEFGQDRIVLVGQSWGTVLALEIAQTRSDLLDIVVLQGLAANWLGSVDRVYNWYLEEARRRGDETEVQRLQDVGPIPDAADPALLDWPMKFGLPVPARNAWYNVVEASDGWAKRMEILRFISPDLSAEEYEAQEELANSYGAELLARHREAIASVAPWDAEADVGTKFDIPIVVMQGAHDWQTSYDLAKAYFERIDAPWKKWVTFPNAAHVLNLEQPGLALATLVNDVLPATKGQIPSGAEWVEK